jgi:uncharacterized protein YijF (DUF1287 family)
MMANNTFFSSSVLPGFWIYVKKTLETNPHRIRVLVDWYRKDDKTHKAISMNLEQEMVITADDLSTWRPDPNLRHFGGMGK